MMKALFYLIGIVAFVVAGIAVASAASDIQLILAGIFGTMGLVAFGVGKMM